MLNKVFRIFSRRSSMLFEDCENEVDFLKKRIAFLESQVQERNESVERAKSIFLKNLYHEIRTPLNSIIGFSDLLEMNQLNDDRRSDYLAHIRDSSREFLKKMDNIIEASIIQAGLLKIEYAESNISDILTEIHAYYSLHKHITEKNIVLLLNLPSEYKDLKLRCDAFRISQIVSNLVSNAFKHTAKGVIEFGFDIEDQQLKFFVIDSGCGIQIGDEENVFKTFSRPDDEDDVSEGLGLGLSLSKSIVELMGGKIWFKSKDGKGAQFYFTLPYNAAEIKESKESRKLVDKKRHFRFHEVYNKSVV